jgi:hypothetical protein
MVHVNTESSQFTDLLRHFDQDLANQCRAQDCPHCAGRLHLARYPRKPRGGRQWREQYSWRWSFCCSAAACRKRTTPPSLCFLGRRIYLGAVVALSACMEQGLSDRRLAALDLVLAVPRRTLKRWRVWWQQVFVHTGFWQVARNALTLTASRCAGCSIAPLLANGYHSMSAPITIRYFPRRESRGV